MENKNIGLQKWPAPNINNSLAGGNPILFIFTLKSIAQQEFSFSQYMFSHQTVNPAYAGSKKVGNFTALHRSQWVGFEGSPVTQSFTFNGPFNSKNLGFGISAVNDRIGPILNTSTNFDLSYHLRLNEADTRLSVGLKFGLHNYNLDSGLINTLEPSDQTFIINIFLIRFDVFGIQNPINLVFNFIYSSCVV